MKSNNNLILDNLYGFQRDFKYKRNYELNHFNHPIACVYNIGEFPPFFTRLLFYIRKKIAMRQSFHNRKYIFQEFKEFDCRLLNFMPIADCFFEGYWQSLDYFADVEDIIRNDLSFIEPQDKLNIKISSNIKQKYSIALHIRFFDSDISYMKSLIQYYKKAINYINNKFSYAHFIIFSDKPNHIKEVLDLKEISYTLVTCNKSPNMSFADMWLMSLCNHFIIAPSTFSWWGAFLSKSNNKIIISPDIIKEGVSSWGFKGLIPDDWIKL